jgi:hypothetical protein
VLGAITTPLILCLYLPSHAAGILDFIRDFTVDVDGGHFDIGRRGHVLTHGLTRVRWTA